MSAWIEIASTRRSPWKTNKVALLVSAWIEITAQYTADFTLIVALLVSAWIEIVAAALGVATGKDVALLVSAWIEIVGAVTWTTIG